MKCISCESEIDPRWKFAIEKNVCPFCGQTIMEEHLKNALAQLSDAMLALTNHQEQLEDWLFVNYSFVKIDSDKFKQFIPEPVVITEKNSTATVVSGELIKVNDKPTEFFARADVKNADSVTERTAHLKEIVNKIKKGSNEDMLLENHNLSEEELEIAAKVVAGEPLEDSSESFGEEEEIPSFVLNMSKNKASKPNAAELNDLQRLQDLQNRTRSAQNKVASGTGGKGSFSRAG